MTRTVVCASILLLSLALTLSFSAREAARTVAVAKERAFLIHFGRDGREAVDWSGNISAPHCRISGWQFETPDEIAGLSWKCATRRQRYWDTPYERSMRPTSERDKVTTKGILVYVEGADRREVQVHTRQGDFSFDTDAEVGSEPRSFLSGRVVITAVPAVTRLTFGPDAEDYPALLAARDGTLWLAYQSYAAGQGDALWVRRLAAGVWSPPEPLAPASGDYFRTALAQDAAGRIWAVWSAEIDGNYDLYARSFDGRRWSPPRRMTTAINSDIFHTLAADAAGNVYLAWQSSRSGNFDIYLRVLKGKEWSPEIQVSNDPADDWEPALAVAPSGRVTVVWDTYAKGTYDIVARDFENGRLGPAYSIAGSGAAETRASAQYDRQGRLWVAFDEGDWNWGKDYGYEIPESGRGLLVRRQVRLAVLENGKVMEMRNPLAESLPEDLRQVFERPGVALDGNGNPWMFYRTRVNLPVQRGPKSRDAYRALWRLGATTFRNGRWSQVADFAEGSGRLDMASAVAMQRDGSLAVVWVSDGRPWPAGAPGDLDLRYATIPAGPAGTDAGLKPFVASSDGLALSHPNEARDVERVREYRAETGGRALRIVRGDIHRHTELSWDGNRDGSLDDSYRYALDAAAFDYLGVCDHQAGESIPYNWWRIQKAVDLYTIRGRFAPLYSYERSLPWPNGHRNVLFDHRGPPVLDPSQAEVQGVEGAAKLYAYLRQFNGITASHTTASGMGTDWRDNDPEVEPIVEIYQGYRSNYETAGAPRSPSQREASRFTDGFVWSAWAKGIKLGVQASSDHVSTHISYAGFYVEQVSREAILASMRARRSFAATDNIFVDLRMAGHFMGESFRSRRAMPLEVYVSGTGPISRVEVIRNNRVVYSVAGAGAEMRFKYTDTGIQPGEAYYYVRAQQQNQQLCWSSPIWVRYE